MPIVTQGLFVGHACIARRVARPRVLWLALLVLLTAKSAAAEVITWEFAGQTTSVFSHTNLDTIFPVGTQATVTLTYDTDFVPLYENPTGTTEYNIPHQSGIPLARFNYSLTLNGHEFYRSQLGSVMLLVTPDGLRLDTFSDIALTGNPVGTSPQWFPVALYATIAAPLTTTDLPTALPSLLSNSTFFMYMQSYGPQCVGESCGANGWVSGTLTSAHRIPTPSTLTLLGLGLAAAAAWRRRRA